MNVIDAKDCEKITVLAGVIFRLNNTTEKSIVDFTRCEKYDNLFGTRMLEILTHKNAEEVWFADSRSSRTSIKVLESIYNQKLNKVKFIEPEKKITKLDEKRSGFYDKVSELAQRINNDLIIDLRTLQGACRYNNIEAIANFIEDQKGIESVTIIGSENFIISEAQSKELATMIRHLNIKSELVGFSDAEKVFDHNMRIIDKDKMVEKNTEIFKKGVCGILKCYESSRALDNYGRSGHGEVKLTMYAEVESVEDNKVNFRLFKSDIFRGYEEQLIDSTSEPCTEYCNHKVDIECIGINEEYYGEKAQFFTIEHLNKFGKPRKWIHIGEDEEICSEELAYGSWIENVLEDWRKRGIYV